MKEEICPVGAKMIIEPFTVDETASGLERSNQGYSTPIKGTVLKGGDTSKFKEGDVVYFRRYSVDELKEPQADGSEKSLFIVEDNDVCAIIKKVTI